MRHFLSIPTYNGNAIWKASVENIKKYGGDNLYVQVIDSSSQDDTVEVAKSAGFEVEIIDSNDFNHGGTRNLALEKHIDNYDIAVFLTQDAIPESGFIEKIVAAFEDPTIACAYGRQLPHHDANPIARHARYFNYPERGHVCGMEDAPRLGIKTVFMSNSFSAYRVSVFKKLGGFPSDTILCEDMYFTAKAVLAGYKVAYVADAAVRHSHNYRPIEEFRRYFDIGVFHADEPWIRERVGGAGGEGLKFIFSELRYLLAHGIRYIPVALLNNFMKITGYKLGQKYGKLPKSVIQVCSMHKRFWRD
ncbi:glycosyltransferase [Dickeya dadantii]|uniref:glycosyltransferase n=1 Tax=Dickeya dadantii TaxID=204038 RepID=UPI001C0E899D|nr:glycosyltransferase [Dickeya dadantii]QWT39988.1 glycosyltransferase [Dickeya dadantii]